MKQDLQPLSWRSKNLERVQISMQIVVSLIAYSLPHRVQLFAKIDNKLSTNPARKDDARIPPILQEYHRRNIVDSSIISRLLLAEHGIVMRYNYLLRQTVVFLTFI